MNEDDMKYVGTIFDQLAELFDREAKLIEDEQRKDSHLGAYDIRKSGRAEVYKACAEAVVKTGTRRMFLFPEPWIGFTVPQEAKP